MNPTVNDYQSLLISRDSNKADLGILLDAAEDYMLSKNTAKRIVSEVTTAIKGWKSIATLIGITKREMNLFAQVLDVSYRTVR